MSWVRHLSDVTPWSYIHRKCYSMLHVHHLAGATIKVANLVNYNYHQLEDGNEADVIVRQCFRQ